MVADAAAAKAVSATVTFMLTMILDFEDEDREEQAADTPPKIETQHGSLYHNMPPPAPLYSMHPCVHMPVILNMHPVHRIPASRFDYKRPSFQGIR